MSLKMFFQKDKTFYFKKGRVIKDGKKHLMVIEADYGNDCYSYSVKKLSKKWIVRQLQIVYLKSKL